MYRKNFIKEIKEKFAVLGFKLSETRVLDTEYYKKRVAPEQIQCGIPEYINPTVLMFENQETARRVKYYVSTNHEDFMTQELANDISSSDGIVVCGYFPDKTILDYFREPKIFIAYSGTGYECVHIENHFTTYLQKNPELYSKYFKDGYFLPSHCESLKTIFDIKPKQFCGLDELIYYSNNWHKFWMLDQLEKKPEKSSFCCW